MQLALLHNGTATAKTSGAASYGGVAAVLVSAAVMMLA
jgi:hypothetical protein